MADEDALNVDDDRRGESAAAELVARLPIGVLVIDERGVIRYNNPLAAQLTGLPPDGLPGRSILEFVDAEDLDFLLESLASAPGYDDELMGPARLRYRHRDGSTRWTEYWSSPCPDSFGFAGYIVTLATESTTDHLTHAAYQIASGAPVRDTLTSVARSVAGHPLVGDGALVVLERGELCVIGEWPFEHGAHLADPAGPWHRVLLTGDGHDLPVDELHEPVRSRAAAAGYRSVWVRGVVTSDGSVSAALVGWRREPPVTSPNQERHLAQVIGVARLAFQHDAHRAALERAALTDPLTGLGNRSMLARHLANTDQVAVLYVDLDGFKHVNDEHGHDVGDMVLVAAARRLAAAVRDEDRVFRIGGDEFIVVCAGFDDERSAAIAELADRIVATLGQPFRIGSTIVETGASVGIATRQPDESTREVIGRADQALLGAKRAGRARWHRALRAAG